MCSLWPDFGGAPQQIYSCRDLNVDLLKTTVLSRELVDRFGSISLSVVNDFEPTHFQSDLGPSLIDIFATNALESVDFLT
jgi:hypothetical protein